MATIEDVKLELYSMKEIGMRVPRIVFTWIESNKDEVNEYLKTLSVSETADAVIDIAELS